VDPLVSICCITYNQSDFIRDAINSFLMQETIYPFEIIVHDDASTDGTDKIVHEFINKYPDKVIGIFQKENQYSKNIKPLIHYVLPKARGKYIALCEGDDFWTDKFKIQKQVEFLENNPECSLCVGGYLYMEQDTGQSKEIIIRLNKVRINNNGYFFELKDLREAWITKFLTTVFRKETIDNIDFKNYKYLRDIHLFYHLLKNGNKGFYFTEIFGVYRKHVKGTNSNMNNFSKLETGFNSYRELYIVNKDKHTRIMTYFHTLGLLNCNLCDKTGDKNVLQNIKLFFYACSLIREIRLIKFLFTAFIPPSIKQRIKNLFFYFP